MFHENNNFENNHYTKYVKEHAQHAVEYGKNLMSTAHNAQTEITKKMTNFCANNLALGKSFLNCSNFNEVVDWTHEFVNSNVNHIVDGASSIYSKTCHEVSKANGDIAKKVSENFANIKDNFHK